MFSSGPNYTKLKTHLRLAISRLKLLGKKKTELAQKARREIADYISAGKSDRARIRVEHIIREDYHVEAMEIVEMYCDLLLARFGLIEHVKALDESLSEAVSSILWVSNRLQHDVTEIKVVSDILTKKYGKEYAADCMEEKVSSISEKLKDKLSIQSPPKVLVEKYLIEIAKSYNTEYEPDPDVIQQQKQPLGVDALLNDFNGMDENKLNNGKLAPPPGFIGYPQPPIVPEPASSEFQAFHFQDDEKVPDGTVKHFVPRPPLSSFPPETSAPHDSIGCDTLRLKTEAVNEQLKKNVNTSDHMPNLTARSKDSKDFELEKGSSFPDLPNVPSDIILKSEDNGHTDNDDDEIDFDDLNRRFRELRKKK